MWDWGTIGSIAFGGLVTGSPALGGTFVREKSDRSKASRVNRWATRGAARSAWSRLVRGQLYFEITLRNDLWARYDGGFTASLPDEERRLLDLHLDAFEWWALENALIASGLLPDVGSRSSPGAKLTEPEQLAVGTAADLLAKAVEHLCRLAEIEHLPDAATQDLAQVSS